jgi:P4 family phage/plasmid primase-like protien
VTEPPVIVAPLETIHAANQINEVMATDTGNVKLFIRRFGDIIRYSPELDRWFIWSGTHWKPDILGEIFELTEQTMQDIRDRAMNITNEDARDRLLDHATKSENEGPRRRIISMARSSPRIAVSANDVNPPDNTLTALNGVVDLATGEIKPHSSARLVTACCSVDYDPDATSPLLDEYFHTFMPDPADQRVLWSVLGRALQPGNAYRLLPMFLGPSTSGKSQLVGTIARVLRGYATTVNASVFRGNLDDKPRPDLAHAVRSRIAFAHEAAQSWDMHGDHVKKLTGTDTIPVRTLYKDIVEVRPTFTPVIVANEMPRVKGADEALRRRLVIIKFDRPLAPHLVDPAKQERFEVDEQVGRAVLAQIVRGARDSMDMANRSATFAEALAEAFDEVDHVGQFLSWMTEMGYLSKTEGSVASHCAKATDLHGWYAFWIKRHGDRSDRDAMMNMRAFGKSLRGRGWESTTANGTRWVGVRLGSDAPWL